MPKVSVIVLAYNTELYIARCLDSLVSQTMEDIEIIVVDDCSTDGTPVILANYASNDTRIRIVRHERNCGSLWGRKTGVDASTGDYIMFVDGDDAVEKNCCERLYGVALELESDLVICGYTLVDITGSVSHKMNRLSYGSDSSAYIKSLLKYEVLHVLWGKLYQKDIWKDREYGYQMDFNYTDDFLLSYEYAHNVKKAVAIDDCLNLYYKNPSSVTERLPSPRITQNIVASYASMFRNVSDESEEVRGLARHETVKGVYKWIRAGCSRRIILDTVRNEGISDLFSVVSLKEYFGLRRAVVHWLILHFDWAARHVVRINRTKR